MGCKDWLRVFGRQFQPWVSHVGWLLQGKYVAVVSNREYVEGQSQSWVSHVGSIYLGVRVH